MRNWTVVLLCLAAAAATPRGTVAQHHHAHGASTAAAASWRVAAAVQVLPMVTAGNPFGPATHLTRREAYLTQPAVTGSLHSPGGRVVLLTTLDFEQFSQPDGEYTLGGWGDGFIDKRHPHTVIHELLVSVKAWTSPATSLSLAAGRGAVTYGTEEPAGRPALKFPTNHQLSQIAERWTANVQWRHRSGWGLEGALFGGDEPASTLDFSNIASFGNSWSARVTRRLLADALETSASYARVHEAHGDEPEAATLMNAAVRYDGDVAGMDLYALVEASRRDADEDHGLWSLLAEAQLTRAGHQPYLRAELATRPEYSRNGAPGTEDFFRYEPDAETEAVTRWAITTIGYSFTPRAPAARISPRPFIEAQHHQVAAERGDLDVAALFGSRSFWSFSAGFRLHVGAEPVH